MTPPHNPFQFVPLWPIPERRDIFLYFTASRPALEPNQLPIQWVLGALPLGITRQGREAEYSSPADAEVENDAAISPICHLSVSASGMSATKPTWPHYFVLTALKTGPLSISDVVIDWLAFLLHVRQVLSPNLGHSDRNFS
jgi:hypothetical protein